MQKKKFRKWIQKLIPFKLKPSGLLQDIDPDLLNTTPDIILDNDEDADDVICSTPIEKENRRRVTRKRTRESQDLEQGDVSPQF